MISLILLVSLSIVHGSVPPVKRAADHAHHHHHHGGHHGHVVRYENHNHPVGPHKCKERKEKKCVKVPHHHPHDECEVVVDIVYIEECEQVVSTHCQQEFTVVHHEAHVVGHDSHVVGHHGHGYHHKRDADHVGYTHGPKCHDKHHEHCHKVPKDHSHKICKTIVDTTETEECDDIVTTHCEIDETNKFHESHVVGHNSPIVY